MNNECAIFTKVDQAMMDLRCKVFVEEQGVPLALELEDDESQFLHICKYAPKDKAQSKSVLVAYARVGFLGGVLHTDGSVQEICQKTAHIGRVAVDNKWRGKGYGASVMDGAERLIALAGYSIADLSAQLTAKDFYEKRGYVAYGKEYVDAGMLHIRMKKDLH
ncbi:MAG: GNAT family N-acetyltransferase [Firmicutes bacterium]|nr:GNAT family N-acetyltransferase [Bacillota bacterium]